MSDDEDADDDADEFAPTGLALAAMQAYLRQRNEGALKLLDVIGADMFVMGQDGGASD